MRLCQVLGSNKRGSARGQARTNGLMFGRTCPRRPVTSELRFWPGSTVPGSIGVTITRIADPFAPRSSLVPGDYVRIALLAWARVDGTRFDRVDCRANVLCIGPRSSLVPGDFSVAPRSNLSSSASDVRIALLARGDGARFDRGDYHANCRSLCSPFEPGTW
jgi:hypothetical protein